MPGWFPSEGPVPMLCDEDDDEDKEEKEGCLPTNKNIVHFCVYRLIYVEHYAGVMQLKRAQNRIIIRMGERFTIVSWVTSFIWGHRLRLPTDHMPLS